MYGIEPWNKGIKIKRRIKYRTRMKMLKNLTDEGRRMGNKASMKVICKPVVAIRDGEFWGRWASASEAARITGANEVNIRACCKGKRPRSGGFEWYYEEDDRWTEIVSSL